MDVVMMHMNILCVCGVLRSFYEHFLRIKCNHLIWLKNLKILIKLNINLIPFKESQLLIIYHLMIKPLLKGGLGC